MREYEPYKPSMQGTGTLDADTLSQCIAALFDHEPIERADGVRNWVYTPAGSLPPLPTNVRSRQIAPNVWEHIFTPANVLPMPQGLTSEEIATILERTQQHEHDAPVFVISGKMKNMLERSRARYDREHRRKLIARRQKRAAFRRKKRGMA